MLTTVLLIISFAPIFAIQWVEHSRCRNANGVVLFYWLLLLLVYTVKLRSLVSQQLYNSSLPYFVTYTVGFGLSAAEFLFEWLWPKKSSSYEALVDDEGEECPEQYATVFSRLTFSWMTPMMKFGYKEFLTEEDLWGLAHSDRTATTGEQFEKAWQYELEHRERPSLWIAMFKAYGGPYMLATVFKVFNDLSAFAQPQLLRYLITFVDSYSEGKEPRPVIQGAAIAIAMFLVATLQTAMIVSPCHPTRTARPCLGRTHGIPVLTLFAAPILPARLRHRYAYQGWPGIRHLQEIPETLQRG